MNLAFIDTEAIERDTGITAGASTGRGFKADVPTSSLLVTHASSHRVRITRAKQDVGNTRNCKTKHAFLKAVYKTEAPNVI